MIQNESTKLNIAIANTTAGTSQESEIPGSTDHTIEA
jgi:hypothetical protein